MQRRTFGLSLVALPLMAVAALSLGCGDHQDAPSAAEEAFASNETPAGERDSVDDDPVGRSTASTDLSELQRSVDEAKIAAILADQSTTEYIAEVVKDGVLTFSEYEHSVMLMAKCIQEFGGGFTHGYEPHVSWRGLYTYGPWWPDSIVDGQEKVERCVNDYIGILDILWKELVYPTESEIQTAMQAMATCLEVHDLPRVPEEHTYRSMMEYFTDGLSDGIFSREQAGSYMDCAFDIEEEFGLHWFAPIVPGRERTTSGH